MKRINVLFLMLTFLIWNPFQSQATASEFADPSTGLVQVDYLNDATSIMDEIVWVANNRSILTQEERMEDIVKHRTANVNMLAVDDDICWRESYGRGAGTIPTGCSSGKIYETGLCYKKCTRPGYEGGGGPLCLAKCPSNFSDTGLHCFKPAAYGRGAGRIPDVRCPRGFSQRGIGAAAWCDNGPTWPWDLETRSATTSCRSNEERNGGLCYPKCKSGYKAFACCVCSPICPSNTVDIGVSCQKNSYGRGVGTIPTGCSNGKENQAGLCYKKCKSGKKGVGPVCWEKSCPSNYPVNCGLSCAISSSKCFMATLDQVTSPLEVALTVGEFAVSGGAITAARKGATMAAKAGVKASAKAAAKTVSKKFTKAMAKKAIKKAMKEEGKTIAEGTVEEMALILVEAEAQRAFNEEQEVDGVDWEDLSLLDPTGISGLVLAYAKPLCADVKNNANKGNGIPNANTRIATPATGAGGSLPKLPLPEHLPRPTSSGQSSSGALPVNKIVRIENKWKTGERINVETGKLVSTKIKDGAWSAMWYIKPVPGTKYYRIENRWKTGHRLHIERGRLESSRIKDGAWSAMWEIIPVPGYKGAYRIQNRWKNYVRIHRERGPLEAGPIKDGAWSAMWYFKTI